jgi:hypothetical protein
MSYWLNVFLPTTFPLHSRLSWSPYNMNQGQVSIDESMIGKPSIEPVLGEGQHI